LEATDATATEALALARIARGHREVLDTTKVQLMDRISHLVSDDSSAEDAFVHLADVVVDANEDNANAISALDELMVAGDADLNAQLGHLRSLLDEFEQTMPRLVKFYHHPFGPQASGQTLVNYSHRAIHTSRWVPKVGGQIQRNHIQLIFSWCEFTYKGHHEII
jgi:hypothetical protein